MSATSTPATAPRFENPSPFQFTREQYYKLGELGFFSDCKVERIHGEIIEQYPNDPVDPSPRPFRFTREQYYQLGELGFFDGKRVELIRGEIVEMSPINLPHATATGLVSDALQIVFAMGFYINIQQPFRVPGSVPGSEPQPDVMVVTGTRRGQATHPTSATLIVEVSDSSFYYDITTKAELYAEANVADYWVLDINNRQLHVFRNPALLPAGLGTFAYRLHLILDPTDTVSPLAAAQATIRVADLLP